MSYLINDEGVCRTAPAKPGLLKKKSSANFFKLSCKFHRKDNCKHYYDFENDFYPQGRPGIPSPPNGFPALCPQYGTAWERRTINSNILQMGQIIKVKSKPAG